MTILLLIATLAIAISLELVRRSRRNQAQMKSELVTEYPSAFESFDRYFHPGHTWVAVTDRRSMKVGVDDFSARILGHVDRVDTPDVGTQIRQGENLAILYRGARQLVHVAPISGKVVDVNRLLGRKPGLINTSPLDQGWLAKILPTNLELDLRNLLKGFAADGWRDAVRAELIQFFSPNAGTVVQDGGEVIGDLSAHLSDEQWSALVRKFYPNILSEDVQNKTKH